MGGEQNERQRQRKAPSSEEQGEQQLYRGEQEEGGRWGATRREQEKREEEEVCVDGGGLGEHRHHLLLPQGAKGEGGGSKYKPHGSLGGRRGDWGCDNPKRRGGFGTATNNLLLKNHGLCKQWTSRGKLYNWF